MKEKDFMFATIILIIVFTIILLSLEMMQKPKEVISISWTPINLHIPLYQEKIKVDTEKVYASTTISIREKPFLTSKVVKIVKINTTLNKVGIFDKWTTILLNNHIYFVDSKYISKNKIVIEEPKKEQSKQVAKNKTVNYNYNRNDLQNYAYNLVINSYGWTDYDFECLVNLWNRESGWNPNAHNKSSGAHGIPQALPASKMASEGSDYYTNGYTQIRWGLKYIKNRYGSPSQAWQAFQTKGWY